MHDVMAAVRKVAPKLAELSDEVIYSDLWERPILSKRDRSLMTIAALIAMPRPTSIGPHIKRGLANGLTPAEIGEIITHMAPYAGWPASVAACRVAQDVLEAHATASDTTKK